MWHPGIPENYRNQIVTGDARELAKALPDESVDLVFTDPPYLRKYIALYEWLANESARVLCPGGFLFAYSGVYWKWDVMQLMSMHMDYWFDMVLMNTGNSPVMWQKNVISRYKSILVYVKRGESPKPRVMALSYFAGGGEDKRYHTWGQDESSARYYIDCFSSVGDVIFDPFAGGGTTAAVCKMLSRNCVSFEIDGEQAEIARRRISDTQLPLMCVDHEQLPLAEALR